MRSTHRRASAASCSSSRKAIRIDHDQKFNATTNVQYVFEKRTGAWAALSWRYDSGLVAGAVASLDDALALTADQQTAIGFLCGNQVATRIRRWRAPTAPLRITVPRFWRSRLKELLTTCRIRREWRRGTSSTLGIGADNLLHTDRTKLRLRFSIINLTNKDALYEFLSTFSGTHFVTPRAFQLQVGVIF
jgi:hypothetical protein